MDGNAHQQYHHADHGATHQGMAEYLACPHEVVGSDEVGHLDREAGRDGSHHTAHEPGGRLDESDAGRGCRTEVSHHGGVDEEHEYGGDLCQNGRYAEVDYQPQLLVHGHRVAHAYLFQQYFTPFCHTLLYIWVQRYA